MKIFTLKFISIIIFTLIIPTNGFCNNSDPNSIFDNLAPAGILYDGAKLLNEKENEAISEILSDHNSEGPGRISVVTIKELPNEVTIEQYAYGLINAIPSFENEKKDRIILLISLKDRELRIETSESVWDILTDKECESIIKNDIAPNFKNKQYFKGIKAGLTAIIDELKEPQPNK